MTAAPSPRTRTAALRALARIAWRDGRAHRARSALVLAMVALPIAALVMGLVYFDISTPSPAQRTTDILGTADVGYFGGDPASLDAVLAEAPADTVVTVQTSVDTSTAVAGRHEAFVIDDVLPDDAVAGPRVQLLEGRLPRSPGEALVAPAVLDAFGVGIGEVLTTGEPAVQLRVTGTVRRPERLAERFALVVPGTLSEVPGARTTAVLLDLADGNTPPDVASGERITREDLTGPTDPDRSVKLGSAFALAALGLAESCLVVAAAFVVGTRRRLRALGLLAAVGATPRHARMVVLIEGVILGVLGSLLGVALGVTAMRLMGSSLEATVGRVVSGQPLPWPLLALTIVLGTLSAGLAVLGPARLAGRLDPVDALASRTPAPAPPGRVARRGILVATVGTAIILIGAGMGDDAIMMLGVAAMVAGALMAVPLLVSLVGRSAPRLPVALRIAARDAARHGRRTGAAVAAAALALALPIALTTITAAESAAIADSPPVGYDHLVLQTSTRTSRPDGAAARDAVGSVVDVVAVAPIAMARTSDGEELVARPITGTEDDDVAAEARRRCTDVCHGIAVGEEDLLRALHAEDQRAAFEAGEVVALDSGTSQPPAVAVLAEGQDDGDVLPVAPSSGRAFTALPSYVISHARASELGWSAQATGQAVYRAAEDVDQATLEAIRAAMAAAPGIAVFGNGDLRQYSAGSKVVMLAAATLVALATLAVATALVASESRREMATLVAVGSSPGTRRRIMGAGAMILGALAAVVAIPAGWLPVTLVLAASDIDYPLTVPWAMFAGAFLAAALAGIGGMLAAREPDAVAVLRPTG